MKRVIGVILAAACATLGCAGGRTGIMHGRIFDSVADSGGLGGARVEVDGTDIAATTGADGGFVLRKLAADTHSITLSRGGYYTVHIPALWLTSSNTIYFSAVMQDTTTWKPDPPPPPDPRLCMIITCIRPTSSQQGPILIIDGVIQMADDPGIAVQPIRVGASARVIARVEVITGAEAVKAYGHRAQHGVVIVTTRR